MRFTNYNLANFYSNYKEKSILTTTYSMLQIEKTFNITSNADIIVSKQDVWNALLANDNNPDGSVGLYAIQTLVAANISGDKDGPKISIYD